MKRLSGLLLLLCVPAAPQETRQSETIRYRDFAGILEEIAKAVDKAPSKDGDKVLVVWLIDNATMLKQSRHGEMLAEVIPKFFAKGRSKKYHAVIAMQEQPQLVLKSTDDTVAVAQAIEGLADAKPDDKIKNCLENVRAAAQYAAGFSGKKFVVMFTQDNGDNEDDVEATLKFLKDTGVVFIPICGEAVYSDPYWESVLHNTSYFYDDVNRYKKLKFQLRGPESAYIEFPYGWPFMTIDPSFTVPSGYGHWALNRLATHSGGTHYVYNIDRSTTTFCQSYGCAVCSGKHQACGATFDGITLKVTHPLIESREAIRARYGKEKLFVAILSIWERLHKSGLLRGAPQLRAAGGALAETRGGGAASSPFAFGSDWRANKSTALRLASDLEKISKEFEEALAQLGGEADKRVLATADALSVHLRALHFILVQLAAFCDEMDRILRARKAGPAAGFASSLIDQFLGARIIGYSYRNLYFCHGGKPLMDVKLLGGEEEEKEKRALLEYADKMIEKHRGTPWEVLVRRAGLVVFMPVVEVREGRNNRDRPRSSSSDSSSQTQGTPNRPGRPTTGGQGGGTATGN